MFHSPFRYYFQVYSLFKYPIHNRHKVLEQTSKLLHLLFCFEKGKGKYHFVQAVFLFSRALCVSFCHSIKRLFAALARAFPLLSWPLRFIGFDTACKRFSRYPLNVYIFKVHLTDFTACRAFDRLVAFLYKPRASSSFHGLNVSQSSGTSR